MQGLRQHASITAPVLSTRGEWQVRRGMPSIDHTYQNSENGLASYVSADHVYPATLGTASDPVPQYPPQLSNLDLLRQRHEAVKQSVEGSLYTRDLSAPPSAPGYVVTPGTIPPPSAASYYPQQREWMPRDEHLSLPPAKPTSNPYSLHSEETLSSGSLNQDSLPDQQFLTTEMEHLAVTSGYSSVIYPSGQKADSLSSSTSSVSSNPSLSSTSSTTGTATTASTSTGNAAGTVPTTAATAVEAGKESQDELKAEIERLRKQLREKDEKIQQQSVQLHYTAGVGGTSAVGGRVSAVPRSVMQQPAPASIQYSSAHYGNGGVVVADDLSRATPQGVPNQVQPTYSGLAQTTPSFGGTLPYNKQQLQAAAALAASIVQGSQSTAGYYPSHPQASVPAAPATHTPHQWSGPQAGVSPYQTAHTLVQLQPSAAARQPSFLVS